MNTTTRAERHAPGAVDYCYRCGAATPTVYRQARSGHVLNACALCGTARRGRPYVPHAFLFSDPDEPQTAAKGTYGDSTR